MGLISILRGYGSVLIFVGIMMIAPLLLAIAGDEAAAGPLLFGVSATIIAGIGAFAASHGRRSRSDFRGALLIILLWWGVTPFFAAIPLALGSFTLGDAYFEAVAALTTTGGWISREDAISSPALMLWRAQLQWIGGFSSIVIAAAIFIRPAFIGIDTLLPPFSRGERGNFLRPMRNAVFSFASVYAGLTLAALIAFSLAGASALDALVMALSGVASGGFLPGVENGLALSVALVAFFVFVFSGANFVVFARFFRGMAGRGRDMENAAYLIIILFVAALFWLLAGAGDVDLLLPQLFNAASILSTNGVIIGEAPPLTAVLVTSIIGGAAVSSAGGFKILRWLVIMRRAREEIRRLITPSAVFGRRRVSNELGVWIHFIVFTMTLAVLVILISMGGHEFEFAATAVVSALANAGPLVYLTEAGADGFGVIEPPYRWALAVAMILGRLEAAVALALINRWFWRA